MVDKNMDALSVQNNNRCYPKNILAAFQNLSNSFSTWPNKHPKL